MGSSTFKKRVWIGGALIVLLVLGAGLAWALSTWSEVNRVTIERPVSDTADTMVEDSSEESPQPGIVPENQPAGDRPDVFLIGGSDSREDLVDTSAFGEFAGHRADVVMVLIRTDSGVAVLSLPRDLWVDDICSDGEARLNRMLEGCRPAMNGPTLLTLTVENLIGETVDHFAMMDFAGFQGAVDAVGGYEICLESAVRDSQANLSLPAGCTMATGEQALAWLRSRRTQELSEDGWRIQPGINDLVRNERQRAFLIDMMSRLADFTSPQAMAATARSVAPFITVDSELTLVEAVDLAWTMRAVARGSVTELDVPVVDYVTQAGAAVLLAAQPVDQIVAGFVAPETADGASFWFTG